MPTVIRFCDRAILLDNGSIVADGDPAEVARLQKLAGSDSAAGYR
jgi:ABC-type branched-subunit amino acid transport system ATPase component